MRPAASGDVEQYLSALSRDARAALQRLRRIIRAAAPGATEGISYRIPVFRYEGKPLVGLAAFEDHCTFFVMSTGVVKAYAAALKRYPIGKGSIRFPAGEPLPATLVKTLVRARIAENRKPPK